MTFLKRLSIRGYRAIRDEVVFDDLGPVVSLHGDNAVGKSSVLRAVDLVSRLCAHVPVELAGTGQPWRDDVFYEAFGQDPWMFNHAVEGEDRSDSNEDGDSAIGGVALSAEYDDGLACAFGIFKEPDARIRLEVRALRIQQRDLLAERRKVMLELDDLRSLEYPDPDDEMPPPPDPQGVAEWEERLRGVDDAIARAVSSRACLAMPSPTLPVSAELRAAWCAGYTSRDRRTRTAVRALAAKFGAMFPALGEGALEPLENAPRYPQDIGWFGVHGDATPLDHLGGGVQSVFSTVGPLALATAPIRLLEEPEAFVGLEAAETLANVLEQAVELGVAKQLWIATHSITLAMNQPWIVERADGTTRAHRADRGELTRFAPDTAPPQPTVYGRMANDGSVRLPQTVVRALGLGTGDPVYFVQLDGKYVIVDDVGYESLFDQDES
jgi:hypothetical protein